MSNFDANLLSIDPDDALSAVTNAGDEGVALIQAWIAHPNAAAVAEVAENGKGAGRKAARRGLSVLKSRGVSVPDRRQVTPKAKAKATTSAWMMAPDATGTCCFIVASREPAGRYRSAFIFSRDGAGILQIRLEVLSKSGLDEAFAKLLPGAPYKPIEVDLEFARSRIARARAAHAVNKTIEPLGLSQAKELIEPVPDTEVTHPFDEEGFDLGDDDARSLASESAALHRIPEFQAWFPPKPAIDEMLQLVGATMRPGDEPDPAELRAKIDKEIVAATDRYFSPERRDALVTVMKDSALSIFRREGEQRALEIVAVMKQIQNRGLITDPPHEVPFLLGFFQKAVSAMAAQNKGSLNIPIPALPSAATLDELAEGAQAPAADAESAAAESPDQAPTESPDQAPTESADESAT